jgi:hypothetical protein
MFTYHKLKTKQHLPTTEILIFYSCPGYFVLKRQMKKLQHEKNVSRAVVVLSCWREFREELDQKGYKPPPMWASRMCLFSPYTFVKPHPNLLANVKWMQVKLKTQVQLYILLCATQINHKKQDSNKFIISTLFYSDERNAILWYF